MMQHYHYRISTLETFLLDTLYPISQILPFGTRWYLSELTILNPFLVIVFLDPFKGPWKLSYWKTLPTPSAFISFGMFANCSQVCYCQVCVHKLNFFIFLIPLWFYVYVTSRLSTVGQDEGGPSWSSLHREPESRPEEENALEVKKFYEEDNQRLWPNIKTRRLHCKLHGFCWVELAFL